MTKFALKAELTEAQKYAQRWLTTRARAVVAFDVGLGKTYVGADQVAQHLRAGNPVPVLWITPASLVPQAVAKLQQLLPDARVCSTAHPFHAKPKASRADQQQHQLENPTPPDVFVVSYSRLYARARSPIGLVPGGLVITDEASMYKSPHGSTWEAVQTACRPAARVLALTATPCDDDPKDSWAIAAAIGVPGLISEDALYAKVIDAPINDKGQRRFLGWRAGGYDVFTDTVSPYFLWAEDDTGKPVRVGPDYVPVKLPAEHEAQVEYWLNDQGTPRPSAWTWTHEWVRLGKARHVALWWDGRQQRAGKAGASALSEITRSPVADAAIRDAVSRGEKVILYTESVSAGVPYICAALDRLGVNYRNIQGKTNDLDRALALDQFRTDPNVQILVASKVLEFGVDGLQEHCRVMISVGSSWSWTREGRQRVGRINRLGSAFNTYEHVTYYPDLPVFEANIGVLRKKERTQIDVRDSQNAVTRSMAV